MRYFIYLSYNGKNYRGWQEQINAVSLPETIQKVLSVILGQPIKIIGAGRTDAEVHAKFMVAHFDFEQELDCEQLTKHLNSFLPFDIAIQKIIRVNDKAHARFSALARTYEYHLILQKNPFLKGLAYRHYKDDLDFGKMNEAARKMFIYKDFTSFSKLHTDTFTNNCTIYAAEWQKRDDMWVFRIQANRFLRNMVRSIVGTLLMVGEYKLSVDDFCKVIEAKDHQKSGPSAPAAGLYLVDIEYPKEIFLIDSENAGLI